MSTARTFRTHAITLKSAPFAERDRLLVLFTPEYGKLRVLAKGVRRTASKLSGHVGLFSYSSLFLVRGRTFSLVTQGETVEHYAVLSVDLWRLSQAFYVAEIVDRFTEDEHPVPGIFEALVLALRRLDDGTLNPSLVVRAFEIELLGLTGYRPQLYRCVSCLAEIQPGNNSFSYVDGGVVCPKCAVSSVSAFTVSDEALRVVRNLQTRPEASLARLRVSNETHGEAERLLVAYIQYLLDIRIRSVGFIDSLRGLPTVENRAVLLG
jgi:DNA repair protein RecO (recombination protein O)